MGEAAQCTGVDIHVHVIAFLMTRVGAWATLAVLMVFGVTANASIDSISQAHFARHTSTHYRYRLY